jgi:dephospho-CoA kinase
MQGAETYAKTMLKVGLTGGMGSGKSTVAGIFEALGVPVYYSDQAAKRLMNEDPELIAEITRYFGEAAYTDGRLNRTYLARLVFRDKEQLDLLNSLVHPRTILDGERWLNQQLGPYAIREAALIFEAGVEKSLDYVIGVSAPLPLRLDRILRRDGISEQQAKNRMSHQLDEADKMERCDFIIRNDETVPVLPQVLQLHEQFLLLHQKGLAAMY